MNPTRETLFRTGGLLALLAGLCYVGVGAVHPANTPAAVTTTPWLVAHLLACGMCCFGILGLAGLYARQAATSGRLGLAGFVLLSLWMLLVMGFSLVEAFILPQAGTVTPAFVDGWMGMFNGTPSTVDLGVLPTLWTLTAPLYIAGGLAFGAATFRAGVLPRGAAVLLAVGTALTPVAVLLPLAAQPKVAIPVGLALAWSGYAQLTERRVPTSRPAPVAVASASA